MVGYLEDFGSGVHEALGRGESEFPNSESASSIELGLKLGYVRICLRGVGAEGMPVSEERY